MRPAAEHQTASDTDQRGKGNEMSTTDTRPLGRKVVDALRIAAMTALVAVTAPVMAIAAVVAAGAVEDNWDEAAAHPAPEAAPGLAQSDVEHQGRAA